MTLRLIALGTIFDKYIGTDPLFLARFPNAMAAYSLRALRAESYKSPIVRIRRDDNVTQDFYLSGSEVSTSEVMSFVGAMSGYVETLYDQSGNGQHASQAVQTRQPKIVDAGNPVLSGGRLALKFDGADDYLDIPATIARTLGTASQDFSVLFCCQPHAANASFNPLSLASKGSPDNTSNLLLFQANTTFLDAPKSAGALVRTSSTTKYTRSNNGNQIGVVAAAVLRTGGNATTYDALSAGAPSEFSQPALGLELATMGALRRGINAIPEAQNPGSTVLELIVYSRSMQVDIMQMMTDLTSYYRPAG
ncbi:hypothetical protein [Serratia fonticola]|uniref:hypothetical protein n=1 Tax=Serratia fonticola TaxID=47917 RepID=UPI0027EEE15C|nr:hypothetical protein [Serratia fonticola]MDQ7212561.1 hypothetical protein [Serratia fonticola]HBE9082740.1 hypothetical protein [Serratia fonticola]HBE9093293.1 hypothetical protein [Serratia fonticola]HBE9155590.1 hypothetical protein [Serratia fonticola]